MNRLLQVFGDVLGWGEGGGGVIAERCHWQPLQQTAAPSQSKYATAKLYGSLWVPIVPKSLDLFGRNKRVTIRIAFSVH